MTATQPDLHSLRTAIESRDTAAVVAWYTSDAEITLVDRDHPPAAPQTLVGIDQITEYYTEICGRNIDHRIEHAVADADTLAYVQHCRYPDGNAVVCATAAELRAGLIHRQTIVQAWDA